MLATVVQALVLGLVVVAAPAVVVAVVLATAVVASRLFPRVLARALSKAASRGGKDVGIGKAWVGLRLAANPGWALTVTLSLRGVTGDVGAMELPPRTDRFYLASRKVARRVEAQAITLSLTMRYPSFSMQVDAGMGNTSVTVSYTHLTLPTN